MKKVFSKKYLLLIILILFLVLPQVVSGFELQLKYPKMPVIEKTLNEIVKLKPEEQLSNFVLYLYYFFLTMAGIAAFVMIVWGGIQYLTSAGRPAVMGEAKDRILKAFLGLIILLSSYLILNTISPSLVLLPPPEIKAPGPPPKIPKLGKVPGCILATDAKGAPSKNRADCKKEELAWVNEQGYVVCCAPGAEGTSDECPYKVGNSKVCTDNQYSGETYEWGWYLCCKRKCEFVFPCRGVKKANCSGDSPCALHEKYRGCEILHGVGCWECCPKEMRAWADPKSDVFFFNESPVGGSTIIVDSLASGKTRSPRKSDDKIFIFEIMKPEDAVMFCNREGLIGKCICFKENDDLGKYPISKGNTWEDDVKSMRVITDAEIDAGTYCNGKVGETVGP